MAEGLLTVAEACQVLGVSERTLRRVLKGPGIEARLQAEHRQGRGKYRQVLLIPPDVITDLKVLFLDGKQSSAQAKLNTGTLPANTGISAASIAGIYEQRLVDKDTLLAEKDKRITELVARAEFAEQTAARAQMLMSLPIVQSKIIDSSVSAETTLPKVIIDSFPNLIASIMFVVLAAVGSIVFVSYKHALFPYRLLSPIWFALVLLVLIYALAKGTKGGKNEVFRGRLSSTIQSINFTYCYCTVWLFLHYYHSSLHIFYSDKAINWFFGPFICVLLLTTIFHIVTLLGLNIKIHKEV